jgi:hypothetical protein
LVEVIIDGYGRCAICPSASSIPNRELVVYALYLLGGDTKRIHTEDIALKCFELFSHSFSWSKYKDYPDKDIVRVALTDARKERFGPLVEGRSGQKSGLVAKTNRLPVEDGWMLTPKGVDWVRENISRFGMQAEQTKNHRQQLLRQIKLIREHQLFLRYINNPDFFTPTIGEIADLLRCRVDAEHDVWLARFKKIELLAKSANQTNISDFVHRCQKAYFEQR